MYVFPVSHLPLHVYTYTAPIVSHAVQLLSPSGLSLSFPKSQPSKTLNPERRRQNQRWSRRLEEMTTVTRNNSPIGDKTATETTTATEEINVGNCKERRRCRKETVSSHLPLERDPISWVRVSIAFLGEERRQVSRFLQLRFKSNGEG